MITICIQPTDVRYIVDCLISSHNEAQLILCLHTQLLGDFSAQCIMQLKWADEWKGDVGQSTDRHCGKLPSADIVSDAPLSTSNAKGLQLIAWVLT